MLNRFLIPLLPVGFICTASNHYFIFFFLLLFVLFLAFQFVDDDNKCYLEINYTFDIRKEWQPIETS